MTCADEVLAGEDVAFQRRVLVARVDDVAAAANLELHHPIEESVTLSDDLPAEFLAQSVQLIGVRIVHFRGNLVQYATNRLAHDFPCA